MVVGERHCFARRVESVQPQECRNRIVMESCVVWSENLATCTIASSARRIWSTWAPCVQLGRGTWNNPFTEPRTRSPFPMRFGSPPRHGEGKPQLAHYIVTVPVSMSLTGSGTLRSRRERREWSMRSRPRSTCLRWVRHQKHHLSNHPITALHRIWRREMLLVAAIWILVCGRPARSNCTRAKHGST